jgi:hypothetical protein
MNYLPRLGLNRNAPDFSLPNSWFTGMRATSAQIFFLGFLWGFLVGLGFELRALCLQTRYSAT